MRLNILIVVVTCLVFSCQNEVDNNTQEDWIKGMDEVIISYNKQAEIESSKVLKENSDEFHVQFYSQDDKGLQKITTNLNIENVIDFNQEIYLLNDIIIMEKTRGFFPLIYKGNKRVSDPCCELLDKVTYYKNPVEGKSFIKQLRVMSAEDKDISINDLEMISYKEKEEYDIVEELSRSQKWLKKIKKD